MTMTATKRKRKSDSTEKIKPLPSQTEMFDVSPEEVSAAVALQEACVAVQVSFSGLGTTRRVKGAQAEEAAETYAASKDMLALSKRIFERGNLTAVHAAEGRIRDYVKGMTYPYPDAGLPATRLLAREKLPEFTATMDRMIEEYQQAVSEFNEELPRIVNQLREKLGRLFDASDYPSDARQHFRVGYTFPNVTLPEYLSKLAPAVYQREVERIRRTFEAAVQNAEQELTSYFADVVGQLADSLAGVKSGERKCFRDDTAAKVFEVLDIFTNKLEPFGIAKGGKLEEQIGHLRQLLQHHDRETLPGTLRRSERISDQMLQQFETMKKSLQEMVETRPAKRRELFIRERKESENVSS